MNLRERFDRPLPSWTKDIKSEVYARIISAPFAEACRQGNREVMKKLVVELWPFVEVFPGIVERGYRKLLNPSFFLKYGPVDMVQLLRRAMHVLKDIKQDEKEHRNLWLDTGSSLGLRYSTDFEKEPLPQVKLWLDSVTRSSNPSETFLSFVAIEMIAESVSRNFLASEKFTSVLGKEGSRWFTVHTIDHGDESHENLEFCLAFTFYEGEADKETASRPIQYVVSRFLDAANVCV